MKWTYLQTDPENFSRTPLLLSGTTDAMLIDGAFTLQTGHQLVEKIKASGKRLTAIFVTAADPDFYFGLAPVCAAFPDAKVYATPTTAQVIRDTVAHKIAVWTGQLGDNGPRSVAEACLPQAWEAQTLQLEGERIDIIAAQQPNRFHLWVPSLKAIFGGIQVVSAMHVWMADTPTKAERDSWVASLDDMLQLQPDIVMPGHMMPGGPTGVAAIKYTRDYLVAFEQELPKAQDGAALIAVMKQRYPELPSEMDMVLELGAKVCKGEVQWP